MLNLKNKIKQSLEKITPHPYVKGYYQTGKVEIKVSKYLHSLELSLKDSLKVINHSPTGFMWGYAGSGPAQLSLAILLIFCSKEQADTLHQEFKWDIISKLPKADFELDFKTIERWIEEHEGV